MLQIGDRVKVQGGNMRHCCYGMVGVISFIRKADRYYEASACVVFDERLNEFGDARDYHWCDLPSLVLTNEPCTVMNDPLDRIRGLFNKPTQ